MINRNDILSIEYLKKTEYTGSCKDMRYRMEKTEKEEGARLLVTVWPEPYNYINTPESDKHRKEFDFSEDGITDAVAWMNDCLFEWNQAVR